MTTKVRGLKKLQVELENTREITACAHWWKIEQASGHMSRGTCRRCGEVREFYNSMPDFNAFMDAGASKRKQAQAPAN
jgi:hypothetical protein